MFTAILIHLRRFLEINSNNLYILFIFTIPVHDSASFCARYSSSKSSIYIYDTCSQIHFISTIFVHISPPFHPRYTVANPSLYTHDTCSQYVTFTPPSPEQTPSPNISLSLKKRPHHHSWSPLLARVRRVRQAISASDLAPE